MFYLNHFLAWMQPRKAVEWEGWSTTVRWETVRQSYMASTVRLIWFWWPPGTSRPTRSCSTTTEIAAKPPSLPTLGSNTDVPCIFIYIYIYILFFNTTTFGREIVFHKDELYRKQQPNRFKLRLKLFVLHVFIDIKVSPSVNNTKIWDFLMMVLYDNL